MNTEKPIQHNLPNGLLLRFLEFHCSNLHFIIFSFVLGTLTNYFFGLTSVMLYYKLLLVM